MQQSPLFFFAATILWLYLCRWLRQDPSGSSIVVAPESSLWQHGPDSSATWAMVSDLVVTWSSPLFGHGFLAEAILVEVVALRLLRAHRLSVLQRMAAVCWTLSANPRTKSFWRRSSWHSAVLESDSTPVACVLVALDASSDRKNSSLARCRTNSHFLS